MRKKIYIGFAFSMLVSAVFPAYSQDIEEPVAEAITAFDSPLLENPTSANESSSQDYKPLRAPAPALSSVYVYAVASTQNGGAWEYIGPNKSITAQDHGGAQLRIAVLEVGYGNHRFASVGGLDKKSYQVNGVCIVRGNYSESCPVGATYVGWMVYFNGDGMQSGNFRYQSTSTNPPFRTLSTSLNIR
ncbi:YolA family protein [Pectobacterium punjabense]|uniref:YolA family protein n=1 Tax=Pectobacterium punjabense TaxID=2108399 RepID=UPI001968F666|nr:YolA family protein [Pectobacterium punjabense]GKW10895.1 hypothetical protein PEC301899_11770 [Pectobacterium carotovorum subsp. carotovorum]MBN3138226.1 YolA family protein [Pectobacterium punjabense]MBT9185245.1 YolA family protein [Pectobacterium punjabense]MCE5380174.1 YolA family protein [Pectobacterium punjabense]MDG0798843.1 YolA family protein [Pectobacterium punjabense]